MYNRYNKRELMPNGNRSKTLEFQSFNKRQTGNRRYKSSLMNPNAWLSLETLRRQHEELMVLNKP